MKRNLFTLVLALFCLCGHAQILTPELTEEMSRRSDDEKIDIVVIMKQQYDSDLLNHRAAHISTRAERRDFVVNELKQHAEATQYDLQRSLAEMESQGLVADTKVLWIANALCLSATKTAIYDMAQRNDIALIGYDMMEQVIPEQPASRQAVSEGERNREIGSHLTHINADDVWNLGYTGEGVVVAIVDSGVNYNHLDLADHLWDGGTEFPHHGYDVFNNDNDPMDDFEHGTHVAGIICGDGTAGQQTGVAPDATLMCVKATNSEGGSNASKLTSGMQWALEHGCDVMSISMGFTGQQVSNRELVRNTCVNVLNAGVVAACAVGNEGNYQSTYPIPYNVRYPGSCPPPYLDPDQQANSGGLSCVISVGCINTNDVPSSFTSRGPSTWTGTSFNDYPYDPGIGLIRPDVCAPGDWVLSLDYETIDDYFSMGGTSQATPCLSGTIALMLSKNPSLTPAQICQIVEETAVPLSRTKSNITGCGRIDALAAVNAVSGGGVQNYTVSVSANPSNGGTVTGGGTYQQGQNCTVSATANSNFTFTNWTESGSVVSTNASYSFTVNSNRTLVANFTAIPQNYTISVSANPSNGGTVTGGGTYQQGQSCTVSATANANFNFTNWTENGSVVSTNASYTFTVNSNRTLVANFTAIPQYTVSVSANPSNGGTVTGGGTYQQGQSCTVSASANMGYDFVNWTENGNVVSTNASYTFTVNSNRTLVANFELQTFEITAVAEPEVGATITGAGTYSYGEQVTLIVETFTDYVFEHWTENGEVVSSEPAYTFTASANRNLVANLLYTESVGELSTTANVYPNPSTDGFTVICEGMTEAFVYSIDGKLVKHIVAEGRCNIEGLNEGVYLLRIALRSGGETIQKIVKY